MSRLGSLHALKAGAAPGPRPVLMVAAHMDSIGMLVTEIVEGFIRVDGLARIDPRSLPGQRVVVLGQKRVPGVVVAPPGADLPPGARSGSIALRSLFVDLGLPARQVERLVRAGDRIAFAQQPFALGEDLLCGPSLDNRASLAALTIALQELQSREHAWDVLAVATVQEEVGFAGAATSAFVHRPDLGLAVDVSYGRGLGLPEHKTFEVGAGPTNGWGPNTHPGVHRALQEAASRAGVPITVELNPEHSGCDAEAIQVAAEGVPTGVIGIPLRYMHSPIEVVHLRDVRQAGLVLAEFACGLEPDFARDLGWDD